MIQPSRYFFLVLFVIAPHALYVPLDVSAIFLMLLIWSGLYCFKNILAPSNWRLRAFTFLAVVYCFLRYGSLINPDAASALLCLVTLLKLFETQSYRDAMALLLILLLVVMAYLIQSYSLLASAYMMISFLGVIYFLMELQRKKYFLKQNIVRWTDLFSLEMVVALPLLVGLFVFFPRFTTRFGSGDKIVQTVGFSEQIELGQLIQLSQSTEVAFKVQFLNAQRVRYDELYFRGSVLTRNKNMSWRKSSGTQEFIQNFSKSEKADYQILLPGRQQKNLFTLDNGRVTHITPQIILFKKKNENIYLSSTPLEHSLNYAVASDLPLPKNFSAQELELSESLSQELQTLAEQWKSSSEQQRVANIVNYFKNNGFSYSTEVPGYKTLDEFMATKVGFCEHYASAFVLFARHLQIPSRVVVGFMGGETNPFDDSLTVRDKFAHAWAEVYYSDSGWTRVDPTAVVYPQRLDNVFVVSNTRQKFYESVFSTSLLFMESINNRFELLMMNFNSDSQWNIIAQLSDFFKVKIIVLALFIPLFFVLLIALLWWLWRFDFKDKDILGKSFQLLIKKIERSGIKREAHEGPLEFRNKVLNARTLSDSYTHLIDEYINLRFAAPPTEKASAHFYIKVKKIK